MLNPHEKPFPSNNRGEHLSHIFRYEKPFPFKVFPSSSLACIYDFNNTATIPTPNIQGGAVCI